MNRYSELIDNIKDLIDAYYDHIIRKRPPQSPRNRIEKDVEKEYIRKEYFIADAVKILYNIEPECQILRGLNTLDIYIMTPGEQICILIMIIHVYENGILIPARDLQSGYPQMDNIINNGKNTLIKKGILRIEPMDTNSGEKVATRRDKILFTPWACRQLFRGLENIITYENISRQTEVITAQSIQEKQLYFEETNHQDIERMYKMFHPDQYQTIIDRLTERGRKTGITCMLHGAPGTGKTELAKQIARVTNRDIMIADVSKLHSSFTGDTEKNYREMFFSYKYLHSVLENAPILLFNEADGILSKRGDILRQAVDKISNRIQNMLLQELEDFEGILIATTNLTDNIDTAFERRFLFKTEIKQPGPSVQSKIWKSLIPELSNSQIETLSSKYNFSGGQIDNIATKRDIDYIIDGSPISFQTILTYCNSEKLTATKTSNIGFCPPTLRY